MGQRRPSEVARLKQDARRDIARRCELLRHGVGRIGLRLTPTQLEALDTYMAELQRWATQVNLTGLKSEDAIIREGFLRSLAHRVAFEPTPLMKAIDVGSGAGFPGLVLKIGYPELDMLLLEPRRKRATFLRSTMRQLELTGVRCIQARVEELHGDAEHQGRYDIAFARAVGPVPDVVRMIEPLLKSGGRLILQVGQRTLDSLPSIGLLLTALGMGAKLLDAPAPDVGFPPTHLLILDKLSRPAT